ncbi:MAG TPA: hypothetical protein VN285_11990 [Candidatus Deferrimicrobium sp.]|nr:hypothetical protein [Candidatus Deferrimicrobium sp.]
MKYMFCRNKVRDYKVWRRIFDSHADGPREAGLHLVRVWQAVDDPNTVYFLFEIHDLESAKAFVSNPTGAEIGRQAGVIDGEIVYLEDAGGYD